MQRRSFLTQTVGLTATLLSYNIGVMGEESCMPISPYVSRCTDGIPANKLDGVTAYQQQSEWCWAACISMVFAYYGHRVSQTRIVQETWGSVVNMPGQPEQILSDLNRTWKDDRRKKFSSSGDSLTANAATAVIDLRENRPLIIGALGHATVLTALTCDVNTVNRAWQVVAATVRDPWPANGGRRILTPQEWYNINFVARISVEDHGDE
jgi:Papain-like cysteine protease AvrRpt2